MGLHNLPFEKFANRNPPEYGDCDAHAVLEMLYTYYSQYNRLDTPQIKSDFETLYH